MTCRGRSEAAVRKRNSLDLSNEGRSGCPRTLPAHAAVPIRLAPRSVQPRQVYYYSKLAEARMQPSSVPAMNAPHAHSPKWVPGPESSGAGRDLDTPSGTPPAVLRSGRVRLHWKLLCARTLDSTAELTAQKLRPAGGARARAQRDSESQNWR